MIISKSGNLFFFFQGVNETGYGNGKDEPVFESDTGYSANKNVRYRL